MDCSHVGTIALCWHRLCLSVRPLCLGCLCPSPYQPCVGHRRPGRSYAGCCWRWFCSAEPRRRSFAQPIEDQHGQTSPGTYDTGRDIGFFHFDGWIVWKGGPGSSPSDESIVGSNVHINGWDVETSSQTEGAEYGDPKPVDVTWPDAAATGTYSYAQYVGGDQTADIIHYCYSGSFTLHDGGTAETGLYYHLVKKDCTHYKLFYGAKPLANGAPYTVTGEYFLAAGQDRNEQDAIDHEDFNQEPAPFDRVKPITVDTDGNSVNVDLQANDPMVRTFRTWARPTLLRVLAVRLVTLPILLILLARCLHPPILVTLLTQRNVMMLTEILCRVLVILRVAPAQAHGYGRHGYGRHGYGRHGYGRHGYGRQWHRWQWHRWQWHRWRGHGYGWL